MEKEILSKLNLYIILFLTIFSLISFDFAIAVEDSSQENDKDLHDKYEKYLKYEKYKDYKKYKEKYGFSSSAERLKYKNYYNLYKSNKSKYASYYDEYKKYRNYKNKYQDKYAKYAKYKKYDKSKYKEYGADEYKDGYERYEASMEDGEDDNDTETQSTKSTLGPEIKVGILGYDKSYSKDNAMQVSANKDYVIKDKDGQIIATVSKDEETYVKYEGDGELQVYKSIDEVSLEEDVDFEAADGNNTDFVIKLEPKTFNEYRGKLRIHYSEESKEVWAISILPLEQYVWGMGEITGTGDMDYNKVMTINFRTYAYKKITDGVINKEKGFDIDTTAGNQVYYGYDWETTHTRIREAAEETWGKMVAYKDDPVWTPYSSSTDGNTRSWSAVWGGDDHPYCKSVPDPYGKQSNAGSIPGNHMVGVSARGAVNLAGEHNKDYRYILKYYYSGINIKLMY